MTAFNLLLLTHLPLVAKEELSGLAAHLDDLVGTIIGRYQRRFVTTSPDEYILGILLEVGAWVGRGCVGLLWSELGDGFTSPLEELGRGARVLLEIE